MYSQSHYRNEPPDLAFEVIRNFGFATILTRESDSPFVSHLPLILEEAGEKKFLIGHCAQANPLRRHLDEGQQVTAIFHGPHSYVSPAWYAPQPDNVPTWNYVTVHIRGVAQIFVDSDGAYSALRRTVEKFEADYRTGWRLPEQLNLDLAELLTFITVFRIDIQDLQAKFKLSQKSEMSERENVMSHLSKLNPEGARLAEYMKKVTGKSPNRNREI